MKLELPDNNASVLFHMGNALQSIARDIDTSLPVNGHKVTHTETVGDVSHSVTVEPLMVMATGDKNPINTDESERRYLDESELSESIDNMTNTIDADGLPWDQRIHSRGKTRLADNTWRMARKPSDKSDEEWAEYVESVKSELKALMAIPVATGAELRALMVIPVATGAELDVLANIPVATAEQRAELKLTPPVVDVNGVEFRQSPGVVHEVEINCTIDLPPVVDSATFEAVANGDIGAGQPVRVVTPPVVDAVIAPPVVDAVIAPPVVDAVDATLMVRPTFEEAVEARGESVKAYVDAVDGLINKINATPPVIATPVATGPTTFPELMKFITVNNKKLTKESVDEALKAQGLASIALLAARTDLIPQVHSALVKLL